MLLPCMILILIMYLLSKKFKFEFTVSGLLKFRNINIEYENEYFFAILRVDLFHIYLIWFKLRIYLRGIFVNLILKSKILRQRKKTRYAGSLEESSEFSPTQQINNNAYINPSANANIYSNRQRFESNLFI